MSIRRVTDVMADRPGESRAVPQLSARDILCVHVQHKREGGAVLHALRQLLASDRLPDAALDCVKRQKLEALLARARAASPFHAQRMRERAMPEGGTVDGLLAAWPILTKEDVRTHASRIVIPGAGRRFVSRTGGTTGTPVEITRGVAAVAWAGASLLRGRMRLGVAPSAYGLMVNDFGRAPWLGRLRMRLGRRLLAPVFAGTDRGFDAAIARTLAGGRIEFVEGFVSDLVELAERLDVVASGIRAVFVTGEMLYDHQRELLQRRFGCRVSTYYGSNEIGGVAAECEHGSLHVNDEHVHLEVVDEANRPTWDVPGRILITDLDNHEMPLIRYQIGDEGIQTRTPCRCGRSQTRLSAIVGRRQDYVSNAAGVRLPATFFAGFFRDLRHVGRLQIVQRAPDHIRVDFEGEGHDASSEATRVCDEIVRRLGPAMTVSRQRVDAVQRTSRGKTPLIRHESANAGRNDHR